MDRFLKFYCDRIMIGLVLFAAATIILMIVDFLGWALVF